MSSSFADNDTGADQLNASGCLEVGERPVSVSVSVSVSVCLCVCAVRMCDVSVSVTVSVSVSVCVYVRVYFYLCLSLCTSSFSPSSLSKFCVRGLTEDEMRGIRAVLPNFRPHQRQQLEFTDSLDMAIEQLSTMSPAQRLSILQSASSSSLGAGRGSGGVKEETERDSSPSNSSISRSSSASAILAKKFKGTSNPGAILSELNKKV